MKCPHCETDSVGIGAKLLVAARTFARCSRCGIALRQPRHWRMVQSVLGDLGVIASMGVAIWYKNPPVLLIGLAVWLVIAVSVPLAPDRSDAITRRMLER